MKDLEAIPEYIVREIKEIIKSESGIIINDDRLIDFEIVMRARIINKRMTPSDYVNLLKMDDNEVTTIASFFTIQESSFYRNKNHYDRLRYVILPSLTAEKQQKDNKVIRILSAGCATGEEPYTIAMILNDLFSGFSGWHLEIIATDINLKAIEFAKEGVYSGYKLRNIEEYYKGKYFDVIKEQKTVYYRVKDSIRKYINFRQCNLIKEPFMLRDLHDIDIIYCENVIIYFCLDSVQRLINNFYDILAKDGYLFLGYSETLNMVKHNFALTWWNDSFAYQKNEAGNFEVDDNTVIIPNKHTEPDADKSVIPYKDFMLLAIQNFKNGQIKNVSIILEEIENRIKELKEDFYIIKAEFLLDNGDYMNAANLCRNAITIDQNCVDAHMILSEIYLQIGMYEKAIFEIKTVLYFNETYALAYYYLAVYYQKINDFMNSIENLKKASELSKKKGGIFEDYIYPVSEKKRGLIKENIIAEKI